MILPDIPHHVTQRGNMGIRIFNDNSHFRRYIALMKEYFEHYGVAVVAFCLMPNHVHLILVPPSCHALSGAMHDISTSYSAWSNKRKGIRGHLWQGRFYSCALDEHHLVAATRYVENNPVRAGLAGTACSYEWSSARNHCGLGRRYTFLCRLPGVLGLVDDWRALLAEGVEEDSEAIRRSTRTGRPCGSVEFCREMEGRTGRRIIPAFPGRKGRVLRSEVNGV